MTSEVMVSNFQIIVFRLHDEEKNKQENYGIPIDQVREIRQLEPITVIPNGPSYVKGVMNLRGTIIPIIDLKEKLGFSKTHTINSKMMILVAEIDSKLVGLLIDGVDQVIKIPSTDVDCNVSGGFESISYVIGIAKTGEKLVVLLDVGILLKNSLTSGMGV
ncbi:chemotaxis protein CheW [Candidatus Nitrosotalea bavarica]|uniref:chemotaxis protein CheW n=1 Tax=Candidatus Nitrosotalea bavarica TaxID=1903277 RepID=UPI000C715722|nr:chemotaxis protein CheW [Candidatus Nitrosotalea bavarica]